MIRYAYSRSAMFAAMGPSTPHVSARPIVGEAETRPWLGLRP